PAPRLVLRGAGGGRCLAQIAAGGARPPDATLVTTPEFAALKRRCLALLEEPDDGDPLPRLTPLGAPETWHFAV
ncbi:MAG: ABC transporter ATP-binding protein, partial [Rhizobacter sp.]